MPRLFIAIWPTEDVASELRALHRKDQRGARFVTPENWHITLRFLGECDPSAVVAAMVGVSLPAATARLAPAVDVLDERALARTLPADQYQTGDADPADSGVLRTTSGGG